MRSIFGQLIHQARVPSRWNKTSNESYRVSRLWSRHLTDISDVFVLFVVDPLICFFVFCCFFLVGRGQDGSVVRLLLGLVRIVHLAKKVRRWEYMDLPKERGSGYIVAKCMIFEMVFLEHSTHVVYFEMVSWEVEVFFISCKEKLLCRKIECVRILSLLYTLKALSPQSPTRVWWFWPGHLESQNRLVQPPRLLWGPRGPTFWGGLFQSLEIPHVGPYLPNNKTLEEIEASASLGVLKEING